ncbi:hypothetical protein B0O99DRAFT_288064 [Bisporella sp. PMI_857]|nr:hypothetical protein B0O99DRAFT_288064 [Bisporella sp. PMI_857]
MISFRPEWVWCCCAVGTASYLLYSTVISPEITELGNETRISSCITANGVLYHKCENCI